MGSSLLTLTVVKKHWIHSHDYFCKSAQYLRSSGRFLQRIFRRFRVSRETCSEWRFGNNENSDRTSLCWSSHQRGVAAKLAARLRTWIRTTSWRSEIIQTVVRRWFEDCWKRSIIHYIWWRGTRWNEESMLRVHISSKWRGFPSERVDSRKHENRPRSWMWRSAYIKNVTVSKSWSNLCFETGTASWVRTMNGTNKYVTETSETISVENMLSTELQGNLWRRQSHDQSLLWHCLSFLFLFVKENG